LLRRIKPLQRLSISGSPRSSSHPLYHPTGLTLARPFGLRVTSCQYVSQREPTLRRVRFRQPKRCSTPSASLECHEQAAQVCGGGYGNAAWSKIKNPVEGHTGKSRSREAAYSGDAP